MSAIQIGQPAEQMEIDDGPAIEVLGSTWQEFWSNIFIVSLIIIINVFFVKEICF